MIAEVLGRFHPLIVHLPIGILIAGYLIELASRRKKYEHFRGTIPFLIQLGILTSVFALFTGWIMPKEGEFDESLIGLHLWFSVAMTISSLLVYLALVSKNESFHKMYFPLFTLCMILLGVSGHFGGSLTHGEGHLTKSLNNNQKITIQDVNTLEAYSGMIQPILKKKCFGCHNEGKKKGGLVMSNVDDLIKGGDNGVVILAGNPDKSPLIQNVHLPLDHDDHMPPEGKKQLTEDEIKLLEWWVKEGAPFEVKVGDLSQSEEIMSILATYEQQEVVIDISNIIRPEKDDLNYLASLGFSAIPIDDQSPLISVVASRDTTLTRSKLNRLKKYKKNIVALDLSSSNVDNDMLGVIPKLKNLQELRLQNTGVTSASLAYVKGLPILQYLNLYNTQVNDEGLAYLDNLTSLKSLYLWDSKVSAEAVNAFVANHPLINVQYQIDEDMFGDAQLKPPLIVTTKDIFEDTINVRLNLNFNNVQIYYSLDGSDPDSLSTLYEDPILLDETATVKAISFKEGWITSELAEKVVIRAGHAISKIELANPPNKKYKGKGGNTLIDHEKGSKSFVDGKWLGYYGQHFTATLDLGSTKMISSVVVSALEDTNSYIFFPSGIEISTSIDRRQFKTQHKLSIPTAEEPNSAELKSFLLSFDQVEARYIKVKILGTLKNPSWHPAPGAKSWFFVDEIMVN